MSSGEAMPLKLQESILSVLDRLQASDLAVSCETMARPGLRVGYIDVSQTAESTLCMFLLKRGASIPLHDHPKMHAAGRKCSDIARSFEGI